MTRAMAVAAALGRARAEAAAARLAVTVAVARPDARVVRDGGDVTIAARGALAALRWPAGLLR